MLKRLILAVMIGYVVLGAVTRAQEAAGAYTCGCDADCWCRKPGLSLFRWVVPRFHKSQAMTEWKTIQR